MSRVRLPWVAPVPVMCLLAFAQLVGAQGRVETGLELRMTDRIDGSRSAVSSAAAPVVASDQGAAADDSPGASPLRGLSLRLTSGVRFDDNVFRSDTNERRDAVVVLKPAIYANGRLGRHDLRLGYEGSVERFQRLGSENFFDHRFLSTVDLDISRILKSTLRADIEYGTDSRGDLTTRPVLGAAGERDRWRKHGIGGKVTLGRRIAKAQFGLAYHVEGVRYLNNAQQERDFDTRALTLTGRYNLGPRLSLLGELGGSWADYLSPASTLDSREYIALAGVAWEATAKTRGELKVGLRHRDYHDLSRSSHGGYTWDARVTWTPKTYSQVTAYTSREVTDGGFSGDAGTGTAVIDIYGVRWRYGLTDRLTFDSGVQRSTAAFDGGSTDHFMKYDAGLRYKVNRWMDFFGEWTLDTRSSATGGFEASGVFLGVDLRIDGPLGR